MAKLNPKTGQRSKPPKPKEALTKRGPSIGRSYLWGKRPPRWLSQFKK